MCVANIIFGQERLTEQFLSMHFILWQRYTLYKTMLVSERALHFQCALSVRAFSLCTWRCWEAVSCAWQEQLEWSDLTRSSEILSKKWHWHWDHHHKFTVAHPQHKPMLLSNQYNLDLKPSSFIWHKGIHALQQPSFWLDYWNKTPSLSSDRIPCFPPTRFSAIYACRFIYTCAWIAKCAQR